MYIKNPNKIEETSFEIIREHLEFHNFNEEELKVVMRMIHTTGDYDYLNIARLNHKPIDKGIELFKKGCKIVTDTNMAFSGINKRAIEATNSTLNCYIGREELYDIAKEKGITRSMAAVEMAAKEGVDIFVVGNAPTALFRIGELIKEGKINPQLIIGVPVGFVGAAESKEYIRGFDIPTITTEGTKGGSNVAASIINALMYMVVKR